MRNKLKTAKDSVASVKAFGTNLKKTGMAKYIPVTMCPGGNDTAKKILAVASVVEAMPSSETMIQVCAAALALYKNVSVMRPIFAKNMSEEDLHVFDDHLEALGKANGEFRKFVSRNC